MLFLCVCVCVCVIDMMSPCCHCLNEKWKEGEYVDGTMHWGVCARNTSEAGHVYAKTSDWQLLKQQDTVEFLQWGSNDCSEKYERYPFRSEVSH